MDSTTSDHVDQEEALLEKYQTPQGPRLRSAGTWAKFIILQFFLIVLYIAAFHIVCRSAQKFSHDEMSLYCSLILALTFPKI